MLDMLQAGSGFVTEQPLSTAPRQQEYRQHFGNLSHPLGTAPICRPFPLSNRSHVLSGFTQCTVFKR